MSVSRLVNVTTTTRVTSCCCLESRGQISICLSCRRLSIVMVDVGTQNHSIRAKQDWKNRESEELRGDLDSRGIHHIADVAAATAFCMLTPLMLDCLHLITDACTPLTHARTRANSNVSWADVASIARSQLLAGAETLAPPCRPPRRSGTSGCNIYHRPYRRRVATGTTRSASPDEVDEGDRRSVDWKGAKSIRCASSAERSGMISLFSHHERAVSIDGTAV